MARAARPPDTAEQLLRDCHTWFERVRDGEEGCDYLNGQSGKYPGDGWNDCERLRRRLKRFLAA